MPILPVDFTMKTPFYDTFENYLKRVRDGMAHE
jgi:hypothetical protein